MGPLGQNDNVFGVLRLFLPETTLEEWALEGRADLRDNGLTVGGGEAKLALTRAVHFSQLVSGADEKRLLGKVKTQTQLQQVGAEQLRESVIVGDAAYDVVLGYIAELPLAARDATGKTDSEADLLASFLLNKMT